MTIRRCLIAPLALQDLNEITAHFATTNVSAGEKFITQFEQKCRYLQSFPLIGRSYNWIYQDLRGVPLQGYIIFYRVTEEQLEILRVVSGRRRLELLFKEEEDN